MIYRQVTTPENSSSVGRPVLKLCGINIPAASVLDRKKELQVLTECIPSDPHERKRFRLVTRAKPVSWPGVKWANVDDARLLIGIYQHGMGSWESIKEDGEIGLKNKILHANKQLKPQASHLKTRADYLLKLLNTENQSSQKKKMKPEKKSRKAAKESTTKNEKISKYFQHKRTSKRAQLKPQSEPEEDESMEDHQTSSNSSNEEDSDDEDFVQEWSTSTRHTKSSGKKPSSNTASKQTKTTVAGSGRSGRSNSKGRVLQSNAKRDVKRKKGKGRSQNPVGGGDIESDYELEEDIFQQCKSILKPVKNYMKMLHHIQDHNLTDPDHKKTILEIGDHINKSLSNYDTDKLAKQWKSHLWIFVAKFTSVSGRTLHNRYKSL